MKGYTDLADLPEDERIAIVVEHVNAHPTLVFGVATDNEPEKVTRYRDKIRAGLPGSHAILEESGGGEIYVFRIGPKPS